MKLNLIVLSLVALGFLTWGGISYKQHHEPYPPAFGINFMGECLNQGATQSFCGCSLDLIQHKYSFREANAITAPSQELKDEVTNKCL